MANEGTTLDELNHRDFRSKYMQRHSIELRDVIKRWKRDEQELWLREPEIPGEHRLYKYLAVAVDDAISKALLDEESIQRELTRQREKDREFICETLGKRFGKNPFTRSIVECVVKFICQLPLNHDAKN